MELLRFVTSKSEGKNISLNEYVQKMGNDQKYIYYITGESLEAVQKSPFLEVISQKGYEVLFLTQVIDEYAIQQLTNYKEKQLKCITKDGLEFDKTEDEKNSWKEKETLYKPLVECIKKTLGQNVEKVVLSNRISESPAILVTGQYGWSANMERIMKAQAMGNEAMHFMSGKKIMEINPDHKLIKGMLQHLNRDNVGSSKWSLEDMIQMVYDSALLASGFGLPDTALFSKRLNKMMSYNFYNDESE